MDGYPQDRSNLLKRFSNGKFTFGIGIIFCLFTVTHLLAGVLYLKGQLSFGSLVDFSTLTLMGLILLGFRILPHCPSNYGWNLNQLRFNVIFGIFHGLLLLGAAFGLRYLLVKAGRLEFRFNPHYDWRVFRYPLVALTQEMISKGFIQTYLISLVGENRTPLAILLASFGFALFHVFVGIPAFIATFFYAYWTGLLFERTRSVLGVTIVHAIGGLGFFFFAYLT